jgi:hypothetical protein
LTLKAVHLRGFFLFLCQHAFAFGNAHAASGYWLRKYALGTFGAMCSHTRIVWTNNNSLPTIINI